MLFLRARVCDHCSFHTGRLVVCLVHYHTFSRHETPHRRSTLFQRQRKTDCIRTSSTVHSGRGRRRKGSGGRERGRGLRFKFRRDAVRWQAWEEVAWPRCAEGRNSEGRELRQKGDDGGHERRRELELGCAARGSCVTSRARPAAGDDEEEGKQLVIFKYLLFSSKFTGTDSFYLHDRRFQRQVGAGFTAAAGGGE